MKKSDLKVGYVVKLRNGNLCMILPNSYDELCLSGPDDWKPVSEFWDDLTNRLNSAKDIIEVYGRSHSNHHAHVVSECSRDLLWQRSEAKKMTVKEICDALGYEVEIVKDGADE